MAVKDGPMTPGQREFIEVIMDTRQFPPEIVQAVEVLLSQPSGAISKDQAIHLIQDLLKAPEKDDWRDLGWRVGGVIER